MFFERGFEFFEPLFELVKTGFLLDIDAKERRQQWMLVIE